MTAAAEHGDQTRGTQRNFDTLQDIFSEREKRQKEMAQELATAAFHAELQRNGNTNHKKKVQKYKSQIESDMARVRQYAAEKKVRTEVKRVSDLQENTNLFSRLIEEKKAKEKMEEKVSLRRMMKSPSKSLSSSVAAETTDPTKASNN